MSPQNHSTVRSVLARPKAPFGPTINATIVVMYAIFVIAYVLINGGTIAPNGVMLAGDAGKIWAAGVMALEENPSQIYQAKAFAAGAAALHGAAELDLARWPYPPHMLLLVAPLATLDYPLAAVLWIGLPLVAFATATGRIVLIAAPATLISIASGQTGALIATVFVAGFTLIKERPFTAGLILGALSVKPHLAVLVPVALVAARAWRTLFGAAVGAIAMVVSAGLIFGWDIWMAWWAMAHEYRHSFLEFGTGPFMFWLPSPFMAARVAGLDAGTAYLVQYPFSAVAAAATWWGFRKQGVTPGSFAILLLATPLATPYLHCYDLTLVAVAVLVMNELGEREGFARGERELMCVLWGIPLAGVWLHSIGVVVAPVVLLTGLLWGVYRFAPVPWTRGPT